MRAVGSPKCWPGGETGPQQHTSERGGESGLSGEADGVAWGGWEGKDVRRAPGSLPLRRRGPGAAVSGCSVREGRQSEGTADPERKGSATGAAGAPGEVAVKHDSEMPRLGAWAGPSRAHRCKNTTRPRLWCRCWIQCVGKLRQSPLRDARCPRPADCALVALTPSAPRQGERADGVVSVLAPWGGAWITCVQ